MNRRGAAPRQAGRQRGFALLIVLWSMVLLTLIATRLTSAGRGDAQLAANLRGAAVAEAAADGAVFEAAFHVLDTSRAHWPADGAPHQLRLPAAAVEVRVGNEAGKVNPSLATPALLAALAQAAGMDQRAATAFAEAIADWRTGDGRGRPASAKLAEYQAAGRDYGPPGQPFHSLDELADVLNVGPAILARLRPHLSAFTYNDPDPAAADPVTARALAVTTGEHAAAGALSRDESLVSIIATANTATGSRFIRRAVLRLGVQRDGAVYSVMEWESVEG